MPPFLCVLYHTLYPMPIRLAWHIVFPLFVAVMFSVCSCAHHFGRVGLVRKTNRVREVMGMGTGTAAGLSVALWALSALAVTLLLYLVHIG